MNAFRSAVTFHQSKPAPCGSSERENLPIGDSAVVIAYARCPANLTPLQVTRGSEYEFYVLPDQRWIDFFIPSGPDGYARSLIAPIQERFRKCKPLPDANWFALAGAIDRPTNHPFFIGSGPKLVPFNAEGRLILFANDARGFYWNNFGCLTVVITRIR
ncbi:MAG: hypothetical protein JO015_02030 [Verrucomicrobia bacterium]|nr:hypothetical protein [Verrucomicrobiota bacterium]